MFEKDLAAGRSAGDNFGGGAGADAGAGNAAGGDGLHHHEINEDEGGGYHSVHTFPDGRKEPADHVDYDDAKSKMDDDFGCGEMSGDDSGDDGAMPDDSGDVSDIAGSYGRKAQKG